MQHYQYINCTLNNPWQRQVTASTPTGSHIITNEFQDSMIDFGIKMYY